jgi:site-specific recombinase XerD
MNALSHYWKRKFHSKPETDIDIKSLLKQPQKASLRDKEKIFTIVHYVQHELKKHGISENSLRCYSCYGLAPIAYFFSMLPNCQFKPEELDEFVGEVIRAGRKKLIKQYLCTIIRRTARIIKVYHAKGFLNADDFRMQRKSKFALSKEFENLVNFYIENICEYRFLSPSTLPTRRGAIRGFLAQLEIQGIHTVDDLTYTAINECITHNAHKYSRGSKDWVYIPRQFLKFLYDSGVTREDFSLAIPDTLQRKRVIREGFTQEEIDKILNAVDKESLNGKRDYAIMIIAAKTGLRATDIINLKLNNVNWRSNEIRIVQQKTGNALSLPLEAEVGNAIADYLLNARPESISEFIFIKHYNPLQSFSRQTATAIVKKHMQLAGIDDTIIPLRGMHSFRRSFGKSLLESSVPLDMINELLGHADMNSSRPYLAIDENGLRNCALGLVLVETEVI